MWKLYTATGLLLVSLFSLLFYQNFFSDNPHVLSTAAGQVASVVGMSVEIESNQYNTLASVLQEKEEELNERELRIEEMEKQVLAELSEERKENRRIFLYISFVGLILLSLIMINFYMDWRKRGE